MICKNLIDRLSGDLDCRSFRSQQIFKLRLEKEIKDRFELNRELFKYDQEIIDQEDNYDLQLIIDLQHSYEALEQYEFCKICQLVHQQLKK